MLCRSVMISLLIVPLALVAGETVNDMMAERSRLFQETRALERDVRIAVHQAGNTSPEIEALRAERAKLENRLREVRSAIESKIAQLPSVTEKRQKIVANKREIERLDQAIRAAQSNQKPKEK